MNFGFPLARLKWRILLKSVRLPLQLNPPRQLGGEEENFRDRLLSQVKTPREGVMSEELPSTSSILFPTYSLFFYSPTPFLLFFILSDTYSLCDITVTDHMM
jgi:hypothetical protein